MYVKTSAGWKKILQAYVKTSLGWKKISQGYVKTLTGWKKLMFGGPVTPITVPVLKNQSGSTTLFYGEDNLTLTRGDWDSFPIQYYLKIQKSTVSTSGYTDVATVTLDNTSLPTSTLATTTPVSDLDAKTGYYYRGYVKADNGSNFYEYTTTPVLTRISFTLNQPTISNITANGATVSWTTAGLTDSTYIYSQQVDIVRYSDGVIVYTTNPVAGAVSAVISSANIISGTTYYAKVTIIANDGWKTSGFPTQNISSSSNFIPFGAPAIVINPTLSPLNNRSYVPMSQTSTATQGTWSGTDLNTTYRYQWLYYSGDALQYQGYSGIAGQTNTTYVVPSNYTSVYGSTIRFRVTAFSPVPGVSTIAASGNGSYATITTNVAHNLSAGNKILITSMLPAGYNGVYTINSVTSNTITYANTTTGAQTGAGSIYIGTDAYSSVYNVEAGPTVTSISATPSSVAVNTNTLIQANIGGYPTSYIVNWGDGTQYNSGALAANTLSVGFSQYHSYSTAGTYIVGITAQPGNIYNSTTVTASNLYTVNFNANGATGSPSVSSVTQATPGAYVTLATQGTMSLSGNTFSGWNISGVGYGSGASYLPSANVTAYAIWSPVVQYTVTYNGNGGTPDRASDTVTAGSSVLFPGATRSGYTFNGWSASTSVPPGSIIGGSGTSYTPTSSITLYAIWTANTCTCIYADAGTVYSSAQCCPGGSPRTGFPTVYNSGNVVCTTCYSGNTVNACCPNVAKIYTKCSANDVTNSASPVYLYCYSTGQCINSTQGAGGSC